MKITLKVYATLTDYLPDHARRTNTLELDVPDDASIASLVAPLHLPPKLVHLVLVNGVYIAPAARADWRLKDGDAVAIWPPIAGG